MSPLSTSPADRIANAAFPGRVVRKDLVRRTKVGANVPIYVLEYLLGKYCASDDPEAIELGLSEVNRQLTEHFVWPDEAGKAQARLKQKGSHRVIDKVKVRFMESEGKFWAELVNFNSRYVHVPEDFVYKYDRLLSSGIWAQVDLVYQELDDDPVGSRRPFWIEGLRPIQVAAFDLDEYREARGRLSRDEWLDLLVRSCGLEPAQYDTRTKLLLLVRLIPMVERNYNLIELGPRGTGKSFIYREINPNSMLVSGGKTTVPQLFGYLDRRRNPGLIPIWDVVAFDEVAGIEFADATAVQMLKDFMESGSYSRGKEESPAEASIVFLGNNDHPPEVLVKTSHLFASLPKAMVDPAFLDRLHYYLPGWEVPKMERSSLTSGVGLVSDYLSEALRELRRFNFGDAISKHFRLGSALQTRDERAVKRTVSGFLKILHPDEAWSEQEVEEYLFLALEGRRRVKNQLRRLAPHEFERTGFTYIREADGREKAVGVPEDPMSDESDTSGAEPSVTTAVVEATQGQRSVSQDREADAIAAMSADELIRLPEGTNLEFKSSMRRDTETGAAKKELERAVIKSVSGFQNGHGGTLLIGVSDSGESLGIEDDLRVLPTDKSTDAYENHLVSLLEAALGASATSRVKIRFENAEGKQLCRIDVEPSPTPVWTEVKGESTSFHVRLGNSTRPLGPKAAHEYIRERF